MCVWYKITSNKDINFSEKHIYSLDTSLYKLKYKSLQYGLRRKVPSECFV